MEVNYKWYKQDLVYEKVLEEQKILDYIMNNDISKYDEILESDKDVETFKALSNVSSNVINWYDMNEDASLLQIMGRFGETTGVLCDKVKDVTVVEFNKTRAEAISKRCENVSNLEIICANLKDIEFDKKFDYITLIGVFEHASNIIQDDTMSHKDCIEYIINFSKKHLKKFGKILIATDNKFGIKYFTGAKTNFEATSFENITNTFDQSKIRLYSKSEIEKILKKCDIEDYKFYYPLPDYKLVNLIYTDEYLPNENDGKINYNTYSSDYEKIIFNENQALKQIIKEGKFDFFANSFFIEISEIKSQIRFVGFNNLRKNKYKLITKMYQEEVKKERLLPEASFQIDRVNNNINYLKKLGFELLDTVENGTVISEFMNCRNFDEIIKKEIKNGNKEEAINLINNWYNYVFTKLYDENYKVDNNIFDKFEIEIEDNLKNRLHFTKHGFLDLVFQNTFYIDSKYKLYDQEWYEENIPIEFIMYRTITLLYYNSNHIHKILPKEELFKKYNITEFLDLFMLLETRWQQSIADMSAVGFYSLTFQNNVKIEDLEELGKKEAIENFNKEQEVNKLINQINNLNEICNERQSVINGLESEVADLKLQMERVYNSRSWRYTKIFRDMRK